MSDNEEETPERSGAAGAAVLTVAALGVGIAVFVYSRDAFVLLVWALGAVAVWWAARTPNKIDNPSPPPPAPPSPDTNTQVSMVRDTTHPNRWAVTRKSPWVTEEIDKEAGTT